MAYDASKDHTLDHNICRDSSDAEQKMPLIPLQPGTRPRSKESIPKSAVSVTPPMEGADREEDLEHITIVWAPIWNMVFRSRGCMCRLGGDSSPFATDVDVPIETPCRLHFPQKIAAELGVELRCPQEGYEPDEDPYFDRFGGRMAFAAFIADNPIIKRSIDVRTLLPAGSWSEASERLRAAGQVKHQREALLVWQKDYQEWYFEWRGNYSTTRMETRKQTKPSRRTIQHEATKRLEIRRSSFS